MTDIIDRTLPEYSLGVPELDYRHDEFIGIVNHLKTADTADFIRLFAALVVHTEKHFHAENKLMQETHFPDLEEHIREHMKVLRDLKSINNMVGRGSIMMARTFISEQLPEWFRLHTTTMDTSLSIHLLQRGKSQERA